MLCVLAETFRTFHTCDLLANDFAPTGKKVCIVRLQDDGTILVNATKPESEMRFTYCVSDGTNKSELAAAGVTNLTPDFTRDLLHFPELQAGGAPAEDAPRLSAVLKTLRGEDVGADGTLTPSSGDAFIPGLFYQASATVVLP
ncbi:hypothetical protein [Tropicimonas aquimaris]